MELQGPALAPAIVGAENGDQFGASLAWIDETILAIGAPGTAGSAGRVALAFDGGTGWDIASITTPIDVAPVAGDQFGFDIAAGSGAQSGSNLFVGAPGRDDGGAEGGAVYRFGVVEGLATWTNSFGYVAGGRVGTSVDTSGDRAVAAGYGGGTLTVQILEYVPNPDVATEPTRPFVWNGDGGPSVGVGFIPEDGPINDYVAIDGTNIAVGRPGGGGSVAVFQRGASGWPTAPSTEIVPAGRQPGDRIGHAVALDGTMLVIGAPGDNGVTLEFPNSGAVYSADVPVTITVDTLGDTVAIDGLCSLREAINAANTDTSTGDCAAGSGADTIDFAVSGAIVLDTRLPIITSDIEIDGTGADITLDGRGGSGTAILRINSGTVALSNLLVFRGNEQSCPTLPTDPDNSTFCGAVLNYGTLNVSEVTFDRNQANNGAGAAIANRGSTSILTVDRSTFTNQSTPFTGAISNWGDAEVSNSTFVDNGRAAIENRSGATMDVVNTTFTGAGVGLNNSGILDLGSSIVNGAVGLTCEGTIIADGFNFDTDGTCGDATTSSGLNLQPLADNGGPTQTVALGAGSAAFDAGDPAVCAAAPVNGRDQRGEVRPQGLGCDSGAYESNGTPAPPVSDLGFVEDFSGGSLPTRFSTSGGVGVTCCANQVGGPVFGSGVVRFAGEDTRGDLSGSLRSYIRTNATDYATVDFLAEVTVTVVDASVTAASPGRNIAFFGLGPATSFDSSGGPVGGVVSSVLPDTFFPRFGGPSGIDSSCGGNGTHRIRMLWTASTQEAVLSIDNDYAGGAFAPDCTLPTVDATTFGLNGTNSSLFIGGDWNTTFDDFVVVIEPPATGEITGVVLDPGGTPVEGASVALGSLGISDLTGVDGSFALTGLPAGDYELSVLPPAGSGLAIEYYPDSFDLANAVPVSTEAGVPLTINLNLVGTVSGVLTDEVGTPLEGVDIFTPQFVPSIGWVQDGPAGITGAGGVYSIELAPGRWAVCARPDFGSGLLGDCVPEGWTTDTPEGDGLLVTEGGSISDANLQFTIDDRALINVTLFDEFGDPATGNLRVLAACAQPANPVLSTALCSSGNSASFAQFSPPDPFDQFSVRLPAGAYNVAAIVSPDGGTTGQISGQTSFTVADGEEFDCTFTMNGAADCVASTPRFVGGSSQFWDDAANWSDGKVPGPDARVVIPDGVGQVEIDSAVSVASVLVEGDLFVLAPGSLTLTGGPTADQGSSVASGGVFIVSGPIDAVAGIVNDGTVVANGATFGAADNGTFVNRNEFVAGPAPGEFIDILIPWESSASSLVDVLPNRDARFAASFTELGRVILRAGADLELAGVVTLGASARVFVDVIGVSSPANFGRLLASGALTVDPGATLFTNPTAYTPTIFDRYTVVDCGSSPCEPFTNTQIGPFAQTLVDGDLVLALPTVVPTFVNDSFGASWNDPVNWSTGIVPTSGSALVPDGAAPRIYPGTSVALDRVTVEGDLFVDDALTVASLDVPVGGIVWAEPGSTVSVSGPVTLDGEISVRSTLALGVGTSVGGSGLVINSGTITTDGAVTLDDPVSVNSGTTSVLDVRTGTLDVQTTGFDPRGVIRVGADATAAFAGDVILRPSSVIDIEVVGSSSFGSLAVAGTLGFAPYGVGEPADATLARLVAPYSGSSPIDIILCGDCSGALFDELDLGAATATVRATAITLSTVNTFTGTGLLASWNNPTNWLYGFVPVLGESAVVPAGRTATINAGSTAVVSDLTLEGTLDIDGTAWLGDAIISGTGTVDNSGTVLSNGATSIGPDLVWANTAGAVVRSETGVLDIEDADFDTNGTVAVDAGALVLIQNDWTAQSTSVLEFEITGPADSPSNYGQFELQSGTLGSAGTLRTTESGYVPDFDDIYPLITCTNGSCTSDPVSAFATFDIAPLTVTSSTSAVRVRGPELPVDLAFSLERTSDPTVKIGTSAIPVEDLDRTAIAAAGGTGTNVAASSLSSIGSDDNSLAALPLKDTLIAEIILQSETLRAIPLVSIDIEGGWNRIVAGVPSLEGEPTSSLTLGQVLDAGALNDETTPAGRVGATPLGAINVDGTPLGAIPLGAIALGSTPLGAIPLGAIAADPSPWCAVLEGFLLPGETCESALLSLSVTEVALRGAPLGAIPLGAIPLGAIDLQESPLGAIPLGAIDLSASPLGAIPLGAIPLGAIGVAGSPLGAIPLGAIPLGAIPLGAIDIVDAPLGAIPLGAIPLGAIEIDAIQTSLVVEEPESGKVVGAPLGAIPLGAILLADVPLGAIPLEENGVALDWCAVLAEAAPEFTCTDETLSATTIAELSVQGVPLGAIPLGAIPLGAIPLGAIDIGSTPLGAIPLGAIPLGAIPLGAIDLGAIPLGAIPLGAIDVADAPLGAIPLGAIPLGAIDIAGSPLGAIPLGAIPLGAIPLGAIPLGAIPLGAIPLGAIPLGAIEIESSPLGAITVSTPLGAIPLGAIPLGAIDIVGSPLGAIPLGAIPLGAIDFDCSLVDCENGLLEDAVRANAIQGEPTLAELRGALDGIRVGDLVGFIDGVSEAELRAAIDAANGTMADLSTLDDLTLADLPAGLQAILDIPLADLGDGLNEVTFADVIDAIIDPATGQPIAGIEQNLVDALVALNQTLADLDTLGNVTLSDLFSPDGSPPEGTTLTLEALEPILGFITVESFEQAFGADFSARIPDETLADLANAGELGNMSLADLSTALLGEFDLADLLGELGLADVLDGYTLADLLFALLDPSSRALGGVSFVRVDVSALPDGSVPSTTFAATFTVDGSRARPVGISVPIPTAAAYVPGSATISVAGATATPLEPVVSGRTLEWTVTAQPGVEYRISFDVLPPVALGTVEIGSTAKVDGTDVSATASASVTVEEGLEPINFVTVDDTIKTSADDVFLTYLSSGTDIDVFEVTVAQDERLVVELSNLDADLDLVLWGRPSDAASALGGTSDEAPLFAITDPDGTSSDAAPQNDFPQLDEVDPTLGVLAVSNLSGTASESLTTGRLAGGTYYIQVVGANGVTNVLPAALQIKVLAADDKPAECQALDFPFPVGAAGALADLTDPDIDTLILVNEQRIEGLYGPGARADVMTAANNLVAEAAADASLGITPVVVSVDAYGEVGTAYEDWDSNPCDPTAANDVVAAINANIIDGLRSQLDHIVILGGDDIIPMARLADKTTIANEYDFRHEFDGDLAGSGELNAFTAPLWESMIRSDEPYGDAAARSLGDRYLYVSDIALGRVVESPAEIVDALDTYVEFSGQLDISTATVLGYDFLADGSEEIADTLELAKAAGGVPLPVDRGLASGGPGDGWDAVEATTKLVEAGTNALVSLNAHFDHYRALPAIGDKDPNFTDNLIATEVATALGQRALEQSLIFSMGCHSGLSVSDIAIGNTNADWAQTLGQQGALYIGNTGYGYGDTEAVAYTEHLMSLFAQQVTSPFDLGSAGTPVSSTVGQALMWAKNEYISELQSFSVYDEKAVMESTFYGLPFYRVGTAPIALPDPPVVLPAGTDSTNQTVQATSVAEPVSTSLGTYFAGTDEADNELVIVQPGRPIQPKQVTDISVEGQVAKGAIVTGMESTYQVVTDPVIASPTFVGGASSGEPGFAGVFPTSQTSITTFTGVGGRPETKLVVATGQYDSATKKQRLDKDIEVVVYYADPDETDVTPPTIGSVTSSINAVAGTEDYELTVSLTAGQLSAPGQVDRVYVLVGQNPGLLTRPTQWTGLDLVRNATTNEWMGSLRLDPGVTNVELTVQAKDIAGNVGYATNKAKNFAQVSDAPPVPPTADDLLVRADPPLASGWYKNSATINVTSPATGVTYAINGVSQGTLAADSFDIFADGTTTWTVATEDGQSTSGQVKVDSDGAPDVVVRTPSTDATYVTGTRKLSASCRDTSGATCRYTIALAGSAGAVVANGSPLPAQPGAYTLTYSATDKVGQTTTGTVPFTIAAVEAPPVIGEPAIAEEPQPVDVPVTLTADFTDLSAPYDSYEVTIDWGDGSAIDSEADVADPTRSVPGSITARHRYDTPGTFVATVTVVDGQGNPESSATTSVTIFDPVPRILSINPVGVTPINEEFELSAIFVDGSVPADESFTAVVDWGDGLTTEADVTVPTATSNGKIVASKSYTIAGTYSVIVTVTDARGNEGDELLTVEIVAPESKPFITRVEGPSTPQDIADGVTLTAAFTDASAPDDSFTATIDWGDGSSPVPASVTAPLASEAEGTISGFKQYAAAGVYSVTVTVTDQAGASYSEDYEYIVVFDPDTNGRVSGKGFYWSGAEAFAGGSRWGAPAFFGYDTKYKRNATVPSGDTQLRLLGEFFFRSTSYDYLIVNDAIAIAEGVGKIGNTQYRFRVQGIDNGWLDFFQITIWDPVTDEVVYDNGVLYDKGDIVLLGGIKVKS